MSATSARPVILRPAHKMPLRDRGSLVTGCKAKVVAALLAASLAFGASMTGAQTPAEIALAEGNVALARDLATATLQTSPKDAVALAVMAAVDLAQGTPKAARPKARAAYRAASTPELRYVAAHLGARAAREDGALLASQLWLRRAVQSAPTPRTRAETIQGIKALRRDTRLKFTIEMAVSPSDNVNNGSNDRVLSVDGRETIFTFDGSALALSGVEASVAVGLRYRLSGTPDEGTEVALRVRQTAVGLSAAANRLAPNARNSDYAGTTVELGLAQTLRFAGNKRLTGGATLTQNWLGGTLWSHQAQVDATLAFPIGQAMLGRVSVSADRQWRNADLAHATALTLRGGVERRLASGDAVGVRLAVAKTLSADANQESTRISAEARYLREKPLAGAHLSMGFGVAAVDYPVFFGGIFGASGREDQSVSASIDMAFPEMGAFGFEPVVSLKGAKTRSNISRYETKALGLEVRIKSSF